MKCDELQRHSIRGVMYNGEEICGGFAYYDADEVDSAIAELKQKLHDAEMQADLAECAVTEYKIDCDKLKAEADEAIADLEESHKREVEQLLMEIAELQKQVHDYAQGLYVIQARAEKEARHQKYKRCLAVAK